MDNDGDLDLAINYTSSQNLNLQVYRNDLQPTPLPPSAPIGGFTSSFQEYSVASSSGLLTMTWGAGSDPVTSTATLGYYVRVSTVAGQSTHYRIPHKYSNDGTSNGNAVPTLYSTFASSGTLATRGVRVALSKQTTAYWAVTAPACAPEPRSRPALRSRCRRRSPIWRRR